MNVFLVLLIIAAVWFLVYIVAKLLKLDERLGWTFGPLFLLMKTKWFNNFIQKIAKKYARFWRLFGNISIVVGFIAMFVSFGLFIYALIDFFLPEPVLTQEGAAVGLIIPGLTISFKTFLYLIIPLILTMIPHELAHGVTAHADGIELKSTGLLFFAVFFGAFVEPNEEQVLNSKAETKMRIFAAGIFPNLILGLLTIPLLIFSANILSPFYNAPDGILIIEVVDNSPAADAGLKRGMVIFALNETHLYNSTVFTNFMLNTEPNQTLLVTTDQGQLSLKLATNPTNETVGYLGIKSIQYQAPKFAFPGKFFPLFFNQELMWTIVISFGAVMLNVLPLPIVLDGDKLLSSFLTSRLKNEKLALIILSVLRFLAMFLFFANLILPIIRFGFVPLG